MRETTKRAPHGCDACKGDRFKMGWDCECYPAPEPTPEPRSRCEANMLGARCTLPATWRTDGLAYGLLFKFCDDHRNESIDLSRSLGGSGGDWVRLPDSR